MEMQPKEGRTARILQWLHTQSEADELDVAQALGALFTDGTSHKIVVANAEGPFLECFHILALILLQ